jgi:hypothetical protein
VAKGTLLVVFDLPHRVTLVYSNRDAESTPFLHELRELEEANPVFRLVLTMTDDPSWKGEPADWTRVAPRASRGRSGVLRLSPRWPALDGRQRGGKPSRAGSSGGAGSCRSV